MTFKTLARTALLLTAASALSGCFLQPGKFDATMTVLKDGRFTFAYEGEIVMAGMNDLADMAAAAEEQKPCKDDNTGKERECTAAERDARAAEEAQGQAMMQAMMGQADMADPQQMAEFAAVLERQAGWNSVEMVEQGVFEVSFSITSRMGHDFDFPTIEGMPMGSSFVQARLRDENRLKIDAPGFGGEGSGNPMASMMGGMMGAMASNGPATASASDTPPVRPIEGTFSIMTNAQILTNNTDEGPQPASNGMAMLSWTITPGSMTGPAALLALEPE